MLFYTKRQPFQPVICTNTLVFSAIFISLIIMFTNVFAIQTPFIRISLSFLPIVMCSILLGPLLGGIVAAIADVLGCMFFSPGLFFPGFTLSSFVSGMIYGYFLHNKKITLQRISLASVIVLLLVDLSLNTLWLSILYQKAGNLFLFGRVLKSLVLLPIQIGTIYAVSKPLLRYKLVRQQ
ncbi:Folate transporter FolT [Sporomusa rhizae]|uniref:folate family ECF transporter S component n=1 Tax=Sporomusa rhizae TaxID=357999 RepID=UPI00352B4332